MKLKSGVFVYMHTRESSRSPVGERHVAAHEVAHRLLVGVGRFAVDVIRIDRPCRRGVARP